MAGKSETNWWLTNLKDKNPWGQFTYDEKVAAIKAWIVVLATIEQPISRCILELTKRIGVIRWGHEKG